MSDQTAFKFGEQLSVGGYRLDELASALQKSIRRLLDDAFFWASELDLSGYGEYAWKRLRIIAMEDVGLANPDAVVQVQSLHTTYQWLKKASHDRSEKLCLMQAVSVLARSPKSRMLDNAYFVFYEGERAHREIPDWALDMHTAAGRAKRRGYRHFFEEGAKVEGEAFEDPYVELAEEVVKSRKPKA